MLGNNSALGDFPSDNKNSASFKFKLKITNQEPTFIITDTTIGFKVVTLSTQDNAIVLE